MITILDWDNTIRRGYTMSTWLEYLHKVNFTGEKIIKCFEDYMNDYKSNKISHDQFAKEFCEEYCVYFRNYSVNEFEEVINGYFEIDYKYLHAFAEDLFKYLNQKKMEIYVVTGAPSIIINRYKSIFGIAEVYGFEPDIKNGKLTGRVKNNYGYDKQVIIKKITEKKHNRVVALGDSESDIPLFENSDIAFIVGHNSLSMNFSGNYLYQINENESFINIRKKLESTLGV